MGSVRWGLAIDCIESTKLAPFWSRALGYVPAPPPAGFATWDEWFAFEGVPEEEWDSSSYLVDPDGVRPSIFFQPVPERKVVKNRLHIDIPTGARTDPHPERWARVMALAEDLIELGGTVVEQHPDANGDPRHLVMADPEGNEFCII